MKVRLIDANVALQTVWSGTADPLRLKNYADHIVRSTPTVDAVPVIRCKDCLYRGKVAYCPMMHLGIHGAVPPYDKDVDLTEDNGFCYKGEKREGENNNG